MVLRALAAFPMVVLLWSGPVEIEMLPAYLDLGCGAGAARVP